MTSEEKKELRYVTSVKISIYRVRACGQIALVLSRLFGVAWRSLL